VTDAPTSADAGDVAPAAPSPPPAASRLAALPSDDWAWLLPHVRAALRDLDETEVTAVVRRLRAAPTSRLAGGRTRRELDELLAAGGPLWRDLARRIRGASEAPARVAELADPDAPRADLPAQPGQPGPAGGPDRRDRPRERAEDRARERLREVRAERDDLRRQLDGATARAVRAEAGTAERDRELATLREQLGTLRRQLDEASRDRDRAVERERRRRDAEVRDLTDTVAALRRAEHDRHVEGRRREEAARQREARDRADAARREAEARDAAAPRRLVPGRPSQLPSGVLPGTTEHAEVLLPPGRLLLVDGYNVTKQHQPKLDLEGQRAWLLRTLAALAARRRVRPRAVFDGEGSGSRPATGPREVEVVFTPAGVTADDELVLSVEATDEPVTVITDDRDLTARLVAAGADVVRTVPFVGVTRAGA
jgi:hypothetical protein